MTFLRNTPVAGALAKATLALTLSLASFQSGASAETGRSAQGTTVSVSSKTNAKRETTLGRYYRGLERTLVASGRLRGDRNPARLAPDKLARNFMAIAMRSEYSLKGGGISRSGHATPLRRWERPVRIGVQFGPSVGAQQRQADLSAIRGVAARLQRASHHPVQVAGKAPNFHVLILNDRERANARPLLRAVAPSLSRAAQNAILRMGPNTFCMVVAIPGRSPSDGYQSAVAVVRAEHPPIMRRSCMEEELAQGMGLPNDSQGAWPSIFNDDEEFGVLTRHDELLLRMLYHDSLQPGMSAQTVGGRVQALAEKVLISG